jgi:hypothetical protein
MVQVILKEAARVSWVGPTIVTMKLLGFGGVSHTRLVETSSVVTTHRPFTPKMRPLQFFVDAGWNPRRECIMTFTVIIIGD